MSLKKQTVLGFCWALTSQGGRQVSQLVVTGILAGLLTPDDFGLVAMALVFTELGNILRDMGVGPALVQKQDAIDLHYHSAFWLCLGIGLLLTISFITLAPSIARFYGRQELVAIFNIISANFLISSAGIVHQAILTKHMEFKKLAFRDLAAILISGTLGILLALHGCGLWSLVLQMVAMTLVNTAFLWIFSCWSPKLVFSWLHAKEILRYSLNLTGFGIVNYFSRNIDKLLIGKVLGAEVLGLYSLAYRLMLYPIQNISWVVNKVMFPAFSIIQTDLHKIRSVYTRLIRAISLVTFPMMCFLFVMVPELIAFVWDSQWQQLVPIFRILCFAGMLQSVGATVGSLYMSQGRTGIQLRMGVLNALLLSCVIIFSLSGGIVRVATAYTIYTVFWIHFSLFIVSRLIKLSYWEVCRAQMPAYFIGGGMFLAMLFLKTYIPATTVISMIALILIGASAYISLLFVTKQIAYRKGTLCFGFL